MDQRTVHTMIIGPVDGPSTNALIQKGLRNAREFERVDIYRIEEQPLTSSSTFLPSSSAPSDASAYIIYCSSVSYDVESNDTEVETKAASDVSEGDCTSQPRLRLSQQKHRLQNVAKSFRSICSLGSGWHRDYVRCPAGLRDCNSQEQLQVQALSSRCKR